jgi:glycosyltransferase involved in cell wall biosynthesis
MFLDRRNAMEGVTFIEVPCRKGIHPSDYSATRALRRYIRQHGPFQIIHGHSSKGGALARLAALGSASAAFYTLHGLIMMDPDLARWKRMFYLGIELGLSLRTSGIIAVSPEEARAAVRLGLGSTRVVMIPNGVGDVDLKPRAAVREALGATDEELLIGFVGRLVEQKALHVLIEALALASTELPQARLVIVGDGPLRALLEDVARRRGVGDRVVWLGERDAREILAGLDVFALSSRKEGLPYVVLEAMSAGLPVVATDSAGVEILVEPGRNGAVVPRDDAAAFARALIDVARDPLRRGQMGAESRRRVREFSIEAMVERTLEAYLERLKP